MSASLVGSEMCIRDSQPGSRSPLADAQKERTPHHGNNEQGPNLGPGGGACLLYTSDAADDM
eukprot:10997871-Alexandrium_andersonii.AAC.1